MPSSSELALVNGTVITVEEDSPAAFEARTAPFPTALSVRDGRVLAVGDTDVVRRSVGDGARVIDLGGRTVVPGLIDSHIHFVRGGLRWHSDVSWVDCDSLATALRGLREPPAGTGGWAAVLGGWHPDQFAERREPTTAELDLAAPDHPVYVQRMYSHGLLNAAAIGRLRESLDAAPEVVRSGFETDSSGSLTGRVNGIPTFGWIVRQIPVPDLATAVSGTSAFAARLNSLGVTGVLDAGGFGIGPDSYDAVFEARRRQELPLRIRLLRSAGRPGLEEDDIADYCRSGTPRSGDDMLQWLGAGEVLMASTHDGLTRTASVEPHQLARLRQVFATLAEEKWSAHLHAHNERLLDAVVDAWSSISQTHPITELRWGLVHAERLPEARIPELSRLGSGVLLQALYRFEGEHALASWGEDTTARCPPTRALLDAEVPIGLGSDATVVAHYNPFRTLSWFLDGLTVGGRQTRSARNRLTRREALFGHTRGSAWFSFEDHERGLLAPGAFADLAVLSGDYLTVPEDSIANLTADITVVDGRVVWEA